MGLYLQLLQTVPALVRHWWSHANPNPNHPNPDPDPNPSHPNPDPDPNPSPTRWSHALAARGASAALARFTEAQLSPVLLRHPQP